MRPSAAMSILAIGLALLAGCGSFRSLLEPPLPGGLQAALLHDPASPSAGVPQRLALKVTDAEGRPAADLRLDHERYAHFIIVASNLEDFRHLHPEDSGPVTGEMLRDATLSVSATFRWGGRYAVAADFRVGENHLHRTFAFRVAGPAQPPVVFDFDPVREVDGMEARLSFPAGNATAEVSNEAVILLTEGGRPVTDLEPWLGALCHLAIIPERAPTVAHAHGGGPEAAHGGIGEGHMHAMAATGYAGPRIHFTHTFAKPGPHRIYAQFQRKGKVHTVRFDVEVEEPFFGP